jgi:hypothetical protein
MPIETEVLHELPPDTLENPPISPIFERPAMNAETDPPVTMPPTTQPPGIRPL